MRNEQELAKLLSGGADANAKLDPQGSTPLLLASSWGDDGVGVVQLLLEHKADANAPNLHGGTPLLCASAASKNSIFINSNLNVYQYTSVRVFPCVPSECKHPCGKTRVSPLNVFSN